MLGLIANSVGVFIGGFLGFLFGKKINKEIGGGVLKAIGVAVAVIGLAGLFKSLLSVDFVDGAYKISTAYELEVLIFLSVGTLIGEAVKIDTKLDTFGKYMDRKLNKGNFSRGFINASLVFSIGAMAILGSISAAVEKNNTILYTKTAIDTITAFIMASTLGFGVIFASIPLFIYQLMFYLLGFVLKDAFTTQEFLDVFCIVGYAIVTCISINFIISKNDDQVDQRRIKIANMLPALLLVIIFYLVKGLFV